MSACAWGASIVKLLANNRENLANNFTFEAKERND
jgi:hypothetical protein